MVDGSCDARQRTQAIEPRQADRERRGGVAGECFALAFEAGREIGRATRSHGVSSGGVGVVQATTDDADGAGRMGKHQCCFGTIVLVFGPNRRFEGFSA